MSAFALQLRAHFSAYFELTKPRVLALILFTMIIGMTLATPVVPPPWLLLATFLGVACVAGAAAAVNGFLERALDARMMRTRHRPLPQLRVRPGKALIFAAILCLVGLAILYIWTNTLTMWLTLGTFLGYAAVYTLWLKPHTPLNIVLGGAAGSMPPVLGWTAVTGQVDQVSLILFFIIFLWTPPHFWALACYRHEEYRNTSLPMLPITHGIPLTCLHSLLYVVMLVPISLLPVTFGLSGLLYGVCALAVGGRFLQLSWRLWRHYDDELARYVFRFSIVYLFVIFAALLADHFLQVRQI